MCFSFTWNQVSENMFLIIFIGCGAFAAWGMLQWMAILCNIYRFYHATHKSVAAAWFYFVARCSNIFSRYLLNGAWGACTGHGVIFSWACGAASGQGMYQVCYSRYRVSFYLWLIGSVLKHCKVPKYYDHDCSLSVSYCAWLWTKMFLLLYSND